MKITATFLVMTFIFLAGCGGSEKTPTPADDGSAAVAKGMAELQAQNVQGAIASFKKAAQACETNFNARLQLSLALLRLGEISAAELAVKEALALDPDSAEARLAEGQVAYLKKDYARAIETFAAVAAETSLPATMRSDALASRGVVELAQGAGDSARVSFLRAMRLNRRNASAWYHLGVLSRDTYRFTEAALEQFEMAARFSDPREERTKKISRDIIPALRSARMAATASKPGVAKRDPAASAKLLAEGEKLQQKKQIRAAIKKYEAAFNADPLSDAAAARLAYTNQRWITAVQIMDHAVAHDPENRTTLDLLIASLQKAGKGKLAEIWKAYRAEVK